MPYQDPFDQRREHPENWLLSIAALGLLVALGLVSAGQFMPAAICAAVAVGFFLYSRRYR